LDSLKCTEVINGDDDDPLLFSNINGYVRPRHHPNPAQAQPKNTLPAYMRATRTSIANASNPEIFHSQQYAPPMAKQPISSNNSTSSVSRPKPNAFQDRVNQYYGTSSWSKQSERRGVTTHFERQKSGSRIQEPKTQAYRPLPRANGPAIPPAASKSGSEPILKSLFQKAQRRSTSSIPPVPPAAVRRLPSAPTINSSRSIPSISLPRASTVDFDSESYNRPREALGELPSRSFDSMNGRPINGQYGEGPTDPENTRLLQEYESELRRKDLKIKTLMEKMGSQVEDNLKRLTNRKDFDSGRQPRVNSNSDMVRIKIRFFFFEPM
jgi:hypothetical protein